MSAYTEIPKIIAETGALPPKVLGDLNSRYPGASSESVEYWVAPPPLGNDENDGSEDYPLATIAAAISRLPDVIRLGHVVTITLLPGHWDERLEIPPIDIHGHLIIQGSSDDRYRHTILDAYTRNVTGHYTIRNIHSSETAPGVNFRYTASGPRMEVINCSGSGEVTEEPHSTGNQGVLADYGSTVIVEDSQFDYKDYALRANYGSTLISRDNTGSGNTFGAGARFGGVLSIQGYAPEGYELNASASSGGIIVDSTGAEIGHNRYNNKSAVEPLALVSADRMQPAPQAQLTKRWAMRSTVQFGASLDIPAGSALRLEFQSESHISATHLITVQFSYQAGTRPHFVDGIIAATITEDEIRDDGFRSRANLTGSGFTPDQMVTTGHHGFGGRFYIDLMPNPSVGGVLAGWYGVNIEMSVMRAAEAPTYMSASVVD